MRNFEITKKRSSGQYLDYCRHDTGRDSYFGQNNGTSNG